MRFTISSFAAALLTAATPAAAQIAVGPLGLVSGDAEVSRWVSSPQDRGDGTTAIWWVTFFGTPSESDGMDRAAFAYHVDCATDRLSQRRYELHAGGRLLRATDQDQPWHAPVAAWADAEVVAYACGRATPTVVVPDADAASRHFGRDRR